MKETIQMYLIQETTSGFICANDTHFGLPAGEWFPKNSPSIKSEIAE